MNTIIKIKLPNELYLTAEAAEFGEEPKQLFVGITDENDRWLQDLVIIHGYSKENLSIMVFADSEDEDYTNDFNVGFWKGGE